MKKLKSTAIIILFASLASSLFALAPDDEQIELRYTPSFRDGTLVWLVRSRDGCTRCVVYRLRAESDGDMMTHSKSLPEVIKEVVITGEQFEVLGRAIEGLAFRREGEKHSGPTDGEVWTFRHKLGARMLQYQFRSPTESSEAYRLGMDFARLAKLDSLEPPQK